MIKLLTTIGLVIFLSEIQWESLINASDVTTENNSLLDGDPSSSNATVPSTLSPSDFYIIDFNETASPPELPILTISSLSPSPSSSLTSSASSPSLLPSSLNSAESISSTSFSLPTDFGNSTTANFSITYRLDDLHSEGSFQHYRQDMGPWIKHDSTQGYGNRPSSQSSSTSDSSNDDYDEDNKPVHRSNTNYNNRPAHQHDRPSSHFYPTSSSSSSSSSSPTPGKSQVLRHEYSYQPVSRSTGFQYHGPQARQSNEDSGSNREDYRRINRKDSRKDQTHNEGNSVSGPVVRHEWINIDHGSSRSEGAADVPIPLPNSQPSNSYSNSNNNPNSNNNNQHQSKYQPSGYPAPQPGSPNQRQSNQAYSPQPQPQPQSTSESDDSWDNSDGSNNEGGPSIQYDEPSLRQTYDEETSEMEEEDEEEVTNVPEVVVKHHVHQIPQDQASPVGHQHVTTINHPPPPAPTYPIAASQGNNHDSELSKSNGNYWNTRSSSIDNYSKMRKMKEAEKEGLMVLPMSRLNINSRADSASKREYSVMKVKKGKKYKKVYKKYKSKKKKKKKCKKKKCKKVKKCKAKKKKCKKPKKKKCCEAEKEWGEWGWPEMEIVYKKPKKSKGGWSSWGGYGDSYGTFDSKEPEYLNAKDILGAEYLAESPISGHDIWIPEKKEPPSGHSEEEEDDHEEEEEDDQKEDREDKEIAKVEPMSAVKQREAAGLTENGENSNVQKSQQSSQGKVFKPVTKYEVDRPYEVHEVDMYSPKFENDPLNFGISSLGNIDPLMNTGRLDARFPGLTGPFAGQENGDSKVDIEMKTGKGSKLNTRSDGLSHNNHEGMMVNDENKWKKRPPQYPEVIDGDDVSTSQHHHGKASTQQQQQQQSRGDTRDRSTVNNGVGRGQVEGGSSDWKKTNEVDEPWKATEARVEGERWSTDIIHRSDWRVGAKQPPPKNEDGNIDP